MKIIFLGPPGSGKGTQANKLSQYFNIPTLSTGDLLRSELKNNTLIGQKAKEFIESGSLVPDNVINDIVISNIENLDSFILDGYPRNIDQAIILDKFMHENNKSIDAVISFIAEEDILIKRISGRYSCKKCKEIYNKFFKLPKELNICDICGSNEFDIRNDDNEIIIKNRLEVFRKENNKLLDFYEKNNLIYSINALKKEDSIFNELINYLS